MYNTSIVHILSHLHIHIMQAFKRRLFGPRYVWITHGWYPDRWWTQEVTNNTVNCTESQLEEFLVQGRVIALNHLTTPDDRNATTDQGTVSREGEPFHALWWLV